MKVIHHSVAWQRDREGSSPSLGGSRKQPALKAHAGTQSVWKIFCRGMSQASSCLGEVLLTPASTGIVSALAWPGQQRQRAGSLFHMPSYLAISLGKTIFIIEY